MTSITEPIIIGFPFGRLRRRGRLLKDIMIVDDDPKYPLTLRANLNILHNYATNVSVLNSLGRCLEHIRQCPPDLLFVTSSLRPATSFEQAFHFINQAGYRGPIIVCASLDLPDTRRRLMAAGATRVLDRHDTHTGTLIEVLADCVSDLDMSAVGVAASAESPT
jgi:CheY-like chemotaxis protein